MRLTSKPDASAQSGAEDLRSYQQNISEYRSRKLIGIQKPVNLSEVQQLVNQSIENNTPLYPFSGGKNWGLGSKLPVTDGCCLVDLSQMNAIRKVNPRLRYAVVEAGVTQEQLSQYLKKHHPEVIFPMTGSARNTSITGNMLERGVSVRGHRYPYLLGMEIVLGNGETVRTGFWHNHTDPNDGEHVYAPGAGPDLNGLFTQSNMGIVTAVVVRLEKRQARQMLSLLTTEPQLSDLVDHLFELREQQVIQDGIIITGFNDPRTSQGVRAPREKWFASASIGGTAAMQKAAMGDCQKALEKLAGFLDFYPTQNMPENPQPPYMKVIADMYEGIPSNYAIETMAHLGGVDLKGKTDIDQRKDVIGFICTLPAVPFEGKSVLKVIDIIDELSAELEVIPYYNFVAIGPTVLEGFLRIFFNRHEEKAIETSHIWNDQAHQLLSEAGIYPYRLNIEQMPWLYEDCNNTYWKTVLKIKSSLDPKHIIAPGRFCPIP